MNNDVDRGRRNMMNNSKSIRHRQMIENSVVETVGNINRRKKNVSKVRGLRAEQGYTQNYMAELIEISVATYCRKERGIQDFTNREIGIILREFDKKYEDIFV